MNDFIRKLGLCGRNAGGPAPPAQSRTCRCPASGASVVLASAPIEPVEGACRGPVTDAREGVGIALDPIVAIMTSEPSFEAFEAGCARQLPMRLHPFLEPFARPRHLLASRAALDPWPSLSVFCPETCDAQQGEPARQAWMQATEAPEAGLLLGSCPQDATIHAPLRSRRTSG